MWGGPWFICCYRGGPWLKKVWEPLWYDIILLYMNKVAQPRPSFADLHRGEWGIKDKGKILQPIFSVYRREHGWRWRASHYDSWDTTQHSLQRTPGERKSCSRFRGLPPSPPSPSPSPPSPRKSRFYTNGWPQAQEIHKSQKQKVSLSFYMTSLGERGISNLIHSSNFLDFLSLKCLLMVSQLMGLRVLYWL